MSPWEEWKIEQAKRADAVAEAEKRRAAQDAAMRFGSKIASKASRASVSIASSLRLLLVILVTRCECCGRRR